MSAWVPAWCSGRKGGRAEPNMLFIRDERRESFYCLRRLLAPSVKVCVCVSVYVKEKFTFDPQ